MLSDSFGRRSTFNAWLENMNSLIIYLANNERGLRPDHTVIKQSDNENSLKFKANAVSILEMLLI